MRRRKNAAERQVERINQMTDRHLNEYSKLSDAIMQAAKSGNTAEIERLSKQFEDKSNQFMAEIDAEAAIINQDLEAIGITPIDLQPKGRRH